MADTFSKVPGYLLQLRKEKRVNAAEVQVFAVLAARRNGKTGDCFPSVRTIAADTGQSERSVKRHLAHLEAVGAITRHVRYRESGGGQTSTQYGLSMTLAECQNCHPGGVTKTADRGARSGVSGGDSHGTPYNKKKIELEEGKGAVAPPSALREEIEEALGHISLSWKEAMVLVGMMAKDGADGFASFWYNERMFDDPTDEELEATAWLAWDHLDEAQGRGTMPLLASWRAANAADV